MSGTSIFTPLMNGTTGKTGTSGTSDNSKWVMPKALDLYKLNFYGNKRALLTEIADLIPAGTKTIADIFGGTGIVSWFLKHQGYRVIVNDVMAYPYFRHRALIGNNAVSLDESDMDILLEPNRNKKKYFSQFYVRTLGEINCEFLDTWAANVENLDDSIKKSIAVYIPIVCISKYIKHAAIHFTPYGTISGNQKNYFDVDLKEDVISYALDTFRKFIFNNGKQNECHQRDAIELVKEIEAEVIYCDSPYAGGTGDYEDKYAFFDALAAILSGHAEKIDDAYDSKADLAPYTNFGTKRSAVSGFFKFFENSRNTPTIILSYNTTSDLAPEEIALIAKVYGRRLSFRKDIDRPRPTTKKNQNIHTKEVLMVFK